MMEQQDEWGPWIEHDGSGCPAVVRLGVFLEAVSRIGCVAGGLAKPKLISARNWVWVDRIPHIHDIIRYRVRRPRGMVILEALLQDLPQTVTEDSPA